MKSITLLLPFVLMSLLMSVAASAQNYAVGHRTFSFTDAARSNRAVAGHVYYPATTAGDNKTFATGTFRWSFSGMVLPLPTPNTTFFGLRWFKMAI